MSPEEILSRNIVLKDSRRGERCFIIGNGPSLLQQDLTKLRNETTFAMNSFYQSDYISEQWHPTFYCVADGLFFDEERKEIELLEEIVNKTNRSRFILPMLADGHINTYEVVSRRGLFNGVEKYYVLYGNPWNDDFAKYKEPIDLAKSVPSVMNIAQLAIEVALYMGFSKIYLIGMDHDWLAHPQGQASYCFNPKVNYARSSYLSAMEHTIEYWRRYLGLLTTSELHGSQIINASNGGFLDVFPRDEYEELFRSEVLTITQQNNSDNSIDEIFTHLTADEKKLLTALAAECNGNCYVEIGSYLGASSCYIAKGIQEKSYNGARLYCVDTWQNDAMTEGRRDTFAEFAVNISPYAALITSLRGRSCDISMEFTRGIDFIFFDGDHSLEGITADIAAWFPRLNPGATVIFHDIGWAEGVQAAFSQLASHFMEGISQLPNICWGRIKNQLPPFEVLADSPLRFNFQDYYAKTHNPLFIEKQLLSSCVTVERMAINIPDFEQWLSEYKDLMECYSGYGDVIIEKCLEHYVAFRQMNLTRDDCYIDVAASTSSWSHCLNIRDYNAYSLDLILPEGIHGREIGADASCTKLPDGFATALSLQCAFECFEGDADINFMREAGRLLRDAGRLVITPLYLDEQYFVMSSFDTDLNLHQPDAGALRVWRTDPYKAEFSRHYSVAAMCRRIIENSGELSIKIYRINNLDELRARYKGQRIYCDFTLVAEKTHKIDMPDTGTGKTADANLISQVNNSTTKSEVIRVTVIVPTFNRCHLLSRALDSLVSQTYPAEHFEVIVVDNGSTDDTRSVCQDYQSKLRNFKFIQMKHPGLHNGRHAGLNASSGEILSFVDDDIEALPAWLEGVVESFSESEVAMAGGKILPRFESVPPAWIGELSTAVDNGWHLSLLSLLDLGDSVKEVPHEYVWGCNFSIRKKVLEQVGGFHPDSLPHNLLKYRGDGENAVSFAVRDLGYKALYNPKASVHHFVSIKRMSREYIYQRAFNEGISTSYSAVRQSGSRSAKLLVYSETSGTIYDVVNQGVVDGYNYHQQLIATDDQLYEWVLRKNYIGKNGVP